MSVPRSATNRRPRPRRRRRFTFLPGRCTLALAIVRHDRRDRPVSIGDWLTETLPEVATRHNRSLMH